MKIKYNKFLQAGAYVVAFHLTSKAAKSLAQHSDFLSNPTNLLSVTASTWGVWTLGIGLGLVLNRLIMNNLKTDHYGTHEMNLSIRKPKTKFK
jgi:hypothetical protein